MRLHETDINMTSSQGIMTRRQHMCSLSQRGGWLNLYPVYTEQKLSGWQSGSRRCTHLHTTFIVQYKKASHFLFIVQSLLQSI